MGDHRATVKCEFTIHDKTYKQEWGWINWSDDGDGVDRRIVDWFAACWADARTRYEEAVWKAGEQRRREEQEQRDRAEYERLKQKFGAETEVER